MSKTITHYHFLVSPWAYLGVARLEAIARRRGAKVVHKPLLAKLIFPNSGGLALKDRHPSRQAYRMVELDRWRNHLRLPLTLQPAHFPVDDTLAAKCVVAVRESGEHATPIVSALLRAVWAEERNIADPATLEELLVLNGYNAKRVLEEAEADGVETILTADCEQALADGVFGSPTYMVDNVAFWGQDRLDFVDHAVIDGETLGLAQ